MKNLFVVVLFLLFSIVAKAGTDCVDCDTRNMTSGQISMVGSNAGDLKKVGRKIASTAKVPVEIIEEICESVELKDFPTVHIIMREEGFRFEDIYHQIKCSRSKPSLMHFVIDAPAKYGLTIGKMIGYFDQLKLDDQNFDYGRLLNKVTTIKLIGGTIYKSTVLDQINRNIPTLNVGSRRKLEGFRKSLIKRGAMTVAQLNSQQRIKGVGDN